MSRDSLCFLSLAALASAALACAPPPRPESYSVSGPHAHQNLTIFFLHGKGALAGKEVLTLEEALAAKKVVVHETKNVNELAIENVGEVAVFIQAGDIVKGGQQDRTIAYDILLPGKSGKTPLASFCVESGRWSSRGKENPRAFGSSALCLTDNRLKIAARGSKDQREVWKEVAKAQSELSKSLKADVKSMESATSLQLTLESKKVQESVEEYVKALLKAPGDAKDVIGYVVVINGKANNADVFASPELFAKLWPKLLRATAVEAVMNRKEGAKVEAVTKAAAEAFLAEVRFGKSSEAKSLGGHVEGRKETKDNVLFETRMHGALLRGSYLAK